MKKWVYTTLMIVLGLVFFVSAGFLGHYFWQSQVQQSRFTELAQQVEEAGPLEIPVKEDGTLDEEALAQLMYTPMLTPEGEMLEVLTQYAGIYGENPDTVGWIHIPGTKVNYPVMQTPDSKDYYLKRNFDKAYSSHGCIYAQENCNIATSDNVVLYGHHMRDGSMFAPIMDYRSRVFYEEHPYIRFDSLTQPRLYQVMAVFLTTASEGQGFVYHEMVNATSQAEYDAFVAGCKDLSLYDTGVEATYGDQLITLSTCDYTRTNGRLVVVAKRVL